MKKTALALRNSFALALRIIFSVAIIALIIWKYKALTNLDVRSLIDGIPVIRAAATILGVYFIKGITLIVPASLVYIAVGMSMKIVPALCVNIVGIIIEVSVTYLMGIILGGPYVTKKIKSMKKGEKILSIYEKHEKAGIFLIRIIGFPIDFCSLFFGAMRVRYLPYLGLSLAGILPRVILFTILGDKVYNLIPMKYVIPVAAAAVVAVLVIWVVRSALRANRSADAYGVPAYTPICEQNRSVILDTDITTDCDDAGAMAVMFQLLTRYDSKLLGICNSSSDPYANATIKAICEYYGMEEPFVGQQKIKTLHTDDSKYTSAVTAKYCKYEASAISSVDEVEFYTKLLTQAQDNSVTVISIGMMTNISSVLSKNPELFNKKVHSIVAMAGKYPGGKEYNIKEDPLAAINVLENYKGIIVFSGYEVGDGIKTGYFEEEENNPVFDCYKLHCGGELPYLNNSFDLTAVQYAFEGNGSFYDLSKPMDVRVDAEGKMITKKDKFSQRYFIIKKAADGDIADYLNLLLATSPVKRHKSGGETE